MFLEEPVGWPHEGRPVHAGEGPRGQVRSSKGRPGGTNETVSARRVLPMLPSHHGSNHLLEVEHPFPKTP